MLLYFNCLLMYCECRCFCLFLVVPLAGLQCVIVAITGHNQLRYEGKTSLSPLVFSY